MAGALFRPETPDEDQEERPKKRSKFFKDVHDTDSDEDDVQVVSPIKKELSPMELDAGGDEEDEDEDDEDDMIIQSPVKKVDKGKGKAVTIDGATPSWRSHYFGDTIVSAYTLYRSGPFCSLKIGEAISIQRDAQPVPTEGTKKLSKKGKADTVVRFKNAKGMEVGRVAEQDAVWLSKLLDLNVISVTGHCVLVEPTFKSGDSVTLSISPRLLSTAFVNTSHSVAPITTSSTGTKVVKVELLETSSEKSLRERKAALNRLFDSAGLEPIEGSKLLSRGGKKGKSKRGLLEKYEKQGAKKVKEGETGEEEGKEVGKSEIGAIFAKASKNDATLPFREPSESFALSLRPYQKQALGWMIKMEEGDPNAREDMSMHPLWEKYLLPKEQGQDEGGEDEVFYYNPYSGEMSLDFPKCSESIGSGILADEMGLGKTIMLASLIHTNNPFTARSAANNVITVDSTASKVSSASPPSSDDEGSPAASASSSSSSSESDELFSEDSDHPDSSFDPKTKSNQVARKKVFQTQSRLTGKDGNLARAEPVGNTSNGSNLRLKRGAPRATLIVAPMTLLSQWCSELQRSTHEDLGVLMYYGSDRSNINEEIESGNVQIVVTSYGTLCSDFKMSGMADEDGEKKKSMEKEEKAKEKSKGKGKEKADSKARAKKRGLFGVEWFRVVLDEAHLIKSRATHNAKACYALRADKRWCLTGTPIVNRLEDLYSLLHFIKLEPWGNFGFFKAFITTPFEKKDPVALEFIQVILEGILLRREKSMKDKDGNPIVTLPKKHITVEWLKFSKEERKIYDTLYKSAKSKFLDFAASGTVMQNVTAIFSILMRLRQAVLHPSLVLKRLAQNLEDNKKVKGRSTTDKEGDLDEEAIRKLITDYNNDGDTPNGSGAFQSQDLQDILNGKGDEEEECPLCLDTLDTPVLIPKCMHSACKQCVLDAFDAYEMRGEEVRCPMCNSGPISARDVLEIQRGSQKKKALATVTSSADGPSTSANPKKVKNTFAASSSSQGEVLTIIDTSDEESDDGIVIVEPSDAPKAKGALATSSSATEALPLPPSPKATPASDMIDLTSSPVKGSSPVQGKENMDAGSDSESDHDKEYRAEVEEDVKMGKLNEKDDEEPNAPETSPGLEEGVLLRRNDFQSSTKLDALIASLEKVREQDPTFKAVVFSQFTGFLDLIERIMNRERFNNVRLDGTLSQKAREKVVSKFTNTSKSVVLLCSLKAGGVGLNLVAANHVYLMDIWWNSAVENQAIDRIHRFGQTREVYVTRFLIRPSIDEKMLALCQKKTRVINGALGNVDKTKGTRQLAEDFAAIFDDD